MLAILKGKTTETGITLDERQNGETNPISRNQLAINGLRLGDRREIRVYSFLVPLRFRCELLVSRALAQETR